MINKMSEQPVISDAPTALDLDQSQASLAYSIIQTLLEHTRVTSDLVALMAQVLDEDTTKALTATPQWAAYLDSRRAMKQAQANIEKFAEAMTELGESEQVTRDK